MTEIENIIGNYFSMLREYNLPLPEKGTELAKAIEQYVEGQVFSARVELSKTINEKVIKARIEELMLFCGGINGKDFERSMERITELKKGLPGEE